MTTLRPTFLTGPQAARKHAGEATSMQAAVLCASSITRGVPA